MPEIPRDDNFEERLRFFRRDLNGKLLDRHTAAVERINVLRPPVAVASFVTFAATATPATRIPARGFQPAMR